MLKLLLLCHRRYGCHRCDTNCRHRYHRHKPPTAAARNASDHEVGCFVNNTRLLVLSSLWLLLLIALVAPLERCKGAGCPCCHQRCCGRCHHCHPHFCYLVKITHPPLPGMHPTKVGCCLKKRGLPSHHHHCYVSLHHRYHRCCCRCHRCHPHFCHHRRNQPPSLFQECIRPRLVVA